MARGGARPGAGRKPGIPSRRNAATQKAVEESGITPLDFLLSVMRDETEPGDVRRDAAKAAAPYVHPKRSPVDSEGKDSALTVIVQKA